MKFNKKISWYPRYLGKGISWLLQLLRGSSQPRSPRKEGKLRSKYSVTIGAFNDEAFFYLSRANRHWEERAVMSHTYIKNRLSRTNQIKNKSYRSDQGIKSYRYTLTCSGISTAYFLFKKKNKKTKQEVRQHFVLKTKEKKKNP